MAKDTGRPLDRAAEQAIAELAKTFGAALKEALKANVRVPPNPQQNNQQTRTSQPARESVTVTTPGSVAGSFTKGPGSASQGGNPDAVNRAIIAGSDVTTGKRPDAAGNSPNRIAAENLKISQKIERAEEMRARIADVAARPINARGVFGSTGAYGQPGGGSSQAGGGGTGGGGGIGRGGAGGGGAGQAGGGGAGQAGGGGAGGPTLGGVHGALKTVAHTPMTVAGITPVLTGGIGAALGTALAGPIGGIAGHILGKVGGEAAINVLKAPQTLYGELQSTMGVAKPHLQFSRDVATLGRAGGFNPDSFKGNIRDHADWMELYGAGPQDMVDRLGKIGAATRSGPESERMGKFLFQQDARPGMAGMPEGSVEEFQKTITSSGVTGGKMTEGNTVLSEQYFNKLNDVMAIATQKGMDRTAVLQSINEGVQRGSQGAVADTGMLDMIAKITQAGTAGAGSGRDQRVSAEGVEKSGTQWTNDPSKWAAIGGQVMDITDDDKLEAFQRKGDPKWSLKDHPEQADMYHRMEAEKNPLVKAQMSRDLLLPTAIAQAFADGLKKMGVSANGIIVAVKEHFGLANIQDAEAMLNKKPTDQYSQDALKKQMTDLNISPEAQQYAMGATARKSPQYQMPLAVALQNDPKFLAEKDEGKRQGMVDEYLKKIEDVAAKEGLTEEGFVKIMGDPERGKSAFLMNQAGRGRNTEADSVATRTFQEELALSTLALAGFGKILLSVGTAIRAVFPEGQGSLTVPPPGAGTTTGVPKGRKDATGMGHAPAPPSTISQQHGGGTESEPPASPHAAPTAPTEAGAPIAPQQEEPTTTPTTTEPQAEKQEAPVVKRHHDPSRGTLRRLGKQPSAPVAPAPTSAAPTPTESSPAETSGKDDLESRVMRQESHGNPNLTSPKGAVGTMQTMPGTLVDPGYGVRPASDPKDPKERERVGKDYLAAMRKKYGNDKDALVAYNWGPKHADEWIAKGRPEMGLPKETRNYVKNILGPDGGPNKNDPHVMANREPPAKAPSAPDANSAPPASKNSAPVSDEDAKMLAGIPKGFTVNNQEMTAEEYQKYTGSKLAEGQTSGAAHYEIDGITATKEQAEAAAAQEREKLDSGKIVMPRSIKMENTVGTGNGAETSGTYMGKAAMENNEKLEEQRRRILGIVPMPRRIVDETRDNPQLAMQKVGEINNKDIANWQDFHNIDPKKSGNPFDNLGAFKGQGEAGGSTDLHPKSSGIYGFGFANSDPKYVKQDKLDEWRAKGMKFNEDWDTEGTGFAGSSPPSFDMSGKRELHWQAPSEVVGSPRQWQRPSEVLGGSTPPADSSPVTIGPGTSAPGKQSSADVPQGGGGDAGSGPQHDMTSLIAFNSQVATAGQALGGFVKKLNSARPNTTAADTNINPLKVSL